MADDRSDAILFRLVNLALGVLQRGRLHAEADSPGYAGVVGQNRAQWQRRRCRPRRTWFPVTIEVQPTSVATPHNHARPSRYARCDMTCVVTPASPDGAPVVSRSATK